MGLKSSFKVFILSLFLVACLQNQGNQVTQLSITNPGNGLTVNGGAITLTNASSSTSGALLASDFATFAAKEAGLGNPAVSGTVLTSTIGGARSWVSPVSILDTSTHLMLFEDFMNAAPAAATSFGELGWNNTVNGAAAACIAATAPVNSATHPGQLNCSTGTTATGRSAIHTSVVGLELGGGDIVYSTSVYIPTLSTVGEAFVTYFGLADNSAAGNATDGVYFLHDQTNANWRIVTANAGTRTTSDSGVAVVGATWVRLGITINAAGTSARFYINGTETSNSPISTNLPAAGALFGLLAKIEKTNGTTARTINIDYVRMVQAFSTAR